MIFSGIAVGLGMGVGSYFSLCTIQYAIVESWVALKGKSWLRSVDGFVFLEWNQFYFLMASVLVGSIMMALVWKRGTTHRCR